MAWHHALLPFLALATLPAWGAPSGRPGTYYLHPKAEPREGAFTVLMPEGWICEGGVVRLNPASGPMNSVGAKIDFAEKRDAAGTVMIHWLANMAYKDPRYLPGFQTGSNSMGMTVMPAMGAEAFLTQFVFPRQRPRAQQVQIVERKPLPQVVRTYQQKPAAGLPRRFDAAAVTVVYDEGGVQYKEQMGAVIEILEGPTGWWTNHDMLMVRAPVGEFASLRGLFSTIQASIKGNPQWVAGENRGSAQRAHNALEAQRHLQDQRRQVVEHRRESNAQIRYEHWLDIAGKEDSVNPHTGKVEVDSNQRANRWQSANGDVVWSSDRLRGRLQTHQVNSSRGLYCCWRFLP